MTIDDIIRFFSGAADGQRMTNEPVGPINQVMSGAPVVTPAAAAPVASARPRSPVMPQGAPRIENPEDPMQSGVLNTPAYAPTPAAPAILAAPIAQAMVQGPSAASLAPDNRDVGGGQNFALQGPALQAATASNQPGILQRMGFQDGNQAMMALGGALMAAGSPDPAKTAMGIQANQAEMAKLRDAQRRANQPKFTPLQNGAFVMAEVPGMAPQILPVSQVQTFMRETEKMKTMSETEKAVFLERLKNQLKTEAETAKENRAGEGERVQAGLNVQQLNQIADSLEKTDTATGPIIGLLPKWARDIVTPQGASLQDAAERIVQGGLRATLGGQFTQAEGDRFLARAYNPRLSEEQNAQNLRTIAREIAAMQLDKKGALDYFQKNGTLEGFTPNANAGAATSSPPPSNQLQSAVTAAGIAWEPDKYQYRIGPNGQVQRKAK